MMLRSTIGLTDQLVAKEITLSELTPLELTWVMRYAYAQYWYWHHDNRATAAMYYTLADDAATALLSLSDAQQTGGAS